MSEAIDTRQVGRYRVEVHPEVEWRNLSRDADNVGRFALPGSRLQWDWQDDAASYREIRDQAGGPILAIPLSIVDGPYTLLRVGDWDDGDGFYWAPLSKMASEGFEDVAALRACLEGEIRELASELAGDVYGYKVIGPDDALEDSCWGYIGEPDYAMSEGVAAAEWANYRDACRWAELPQWVRDAVLIRGDEWETYPPAREEVGA